MKITRPEDFFYGGVHGGGLGLKSGNKQITFFGPVFVQYRSQFGFEILPVEVLVDV